MAHATFAAYYGVLALGLPLNATATRTASAPTDANDSDAAGCTVVTGLIIAC